jgi:hypothetical protein
MMEHRTTRDMAALPPVKGCESLKLIEIPVKSNGIVALPANKSTAYAGIIPARHASLNLRLPH